MASSLLISEGLRLYFEQPATASDLTFFQNFTLYSWVFSIIIIIIIIVIVVVVVVVVVTVDFFKLPT